jgi:hypothetical protein
MLAAQLSSELKANESTHTMPIEDVRNFDLSVNMGGNRLHQRCELCKWLLSHALSASRQVNQTDINLLRKPQLPAAVNICAPPCIRYTKHPKRWRLGPGQRFEPERVSVACGAAGHHESAGRPSRKAGMGLILVSNIARSFHRKGRHCRH